MAPSLHSAPAQPAAGSRTGFEWPDLIAGPFMALLTERLGLRERAQQPRHVMMHPETGERTGDVTVLDGRGLQAAVVSRAATPMLQMWQVVAFTPPGVRSRT